ncbi:hypothetical protein EG328_009213 [Venturia inaequalis]|uniref:Uncharacterized protein n=1 Tax=Venturia inaequalis TaxID=5025 RepID=A0A8H3UC90_VENIN|nr:hypothetical protein EG328_009213 [Venturia inaequalis]
MNQYPQGLTIASFPSINPPHPFSKIKINTTMQFPTILLLIGTATALKLTQSTTFLKGGRSAPNGPDSAPLHLSTFTAVQASNARTKESRDPKLRRKISAGGTRRREDRTRSAKAGCWDDLVEYGLHRRRRYRMKQEQDGKMDWHCAMMLAT